jgi:hypothetical protein
MNYACPAWEFAAGTHLCLQNKFLLTIGKLPNYSPVRELHKVFEVPHIYDYTMNFAGNKQSSYKINKIQMSEASE